ncbi:MAG: hypothetical protein ACHQ6U_02145 [Thermodesulfobacteriota bacterium]
MKKAVHPFTAASFLDSIGINTHWTYPDTPYVYAYEGVLKLLAELGIRHVRDGFSDRIVELGKYGITTTVIADLEGSSNGGNGTIRKIIGRIKSINASGIHIDAVEGPNEPDNFWPKHKKIYKGYGHMHGRRGFIMGAVEFQKDLYRAIKCDPSTAGLCVIGFAICPVYDPLGLSPNPLSEQELAPYADWGNLHSYPGNNPYNVPFPYAGLERYYWQSNFPSISLDEYPWALEVYAPPFSPKPMAVTEAGYPTHVGGVSERAQAKYIPRLCCEYFRLGIRRTYIYELVDEFHEVNKEDPEAHYGLVRRDLTPKPAYTALKSLLHILKDSREEFVQRYIDYELSVTGSKDYFRTDFLHHLVLQKRDGDYYFLLWHEISCEDISVIPHKELSHPDMNVNLAIKRPIIQAVQYSYDNSWNLIPRELPAGANTLNFAVSDNATVLCITLGS